MTTRKYSSTSQQTSLTSTLTSSAITMAVSSATTLLGGITIAANEVFTVVIDPDTSLEEIVDITSASGNPVSANNITIQRGVDGSSAQSHSVGAIIRHMIVGRDLREPNVHLAGTANVHGISSTSAVVGTQDTQTLYNKTLVAPILTSTTENDAGISFQGTTVDAYATTLNVVDPTANRTITLPNTSGTVTLLDAAQTISNKTLGGNLAAGGFTVTGLATPVNATDAVTKTYADANLAAAATSAASAATSASSAATSASSAATSASTATTQAANALTSANSAATSAASAATSASTATTQAANAVTSANSAATSAASAATSAASAAASVIASQYTAVGDILQGTGTGTATKLSIATTSGWHLVSNGTTAAWAAPAAATYSAPTIGSTSIGSGATVTIINGLTKLVSATYASLDASGYEVDIALMQIMGAY